MNLNEFRAQYPQYKDVSDDDLAKGLHQKYYPTIPFEQFSSVIGLAQPAKQPEIKPALEADPRLADPRLAGLITDTKPKSSVMAGKDGVVTQSNPAASETFKRAIEDNRQPNQVQPGAKIVDGYRGILEVGAKRGYAGLGRVEAGAMQAIADATGWDTFQNIATALNSRANDIESGTVLRGTPVEGFSKESIIQDLPEAGANAVASIIQTAPAIGAGALSGGSALPTIFATTGAQEYMQGRDAGVTPAQALQRAVPMAAFEVIGEKVGGIDKLTKALNAASTGNGFADLGVAMIASAIREQPGEQITTAGQFITDLSPQFGLNQDATFSDYLHAAKDTALATALQGGAMGGGGAVIQQLSAKQIADKAQADISSATSVDDALKAFDTITETLGATNVSPITQQPVATVATGSGITQTNNQPGSAANINVEPIAGGVDNSDLGSGQGIADNVPVGVGVSQPVDNLADPILAEALQTAANIQPAGSVKEDLSAGNKDTLQTVYTPELLSPDIVKNKLNVPDQSPTPRADYSVVTQEFQQASSSIPAESGSVSLGAQIDAVAIESPMLQQAAIEDARPLIESIVSRREAANKLGKLKQFDDALKLAEGFMRGKQVKPSRFKLAASNFKGDQRLSDAFNRLHVVANKQTQNFNNTLSTEALPKFSRDIFFSPGIGELVELKSAKDQSHANLLNDALVSYGLGDKWRNAYETVDVPDTLLEFGKEIQAAFGRDVRFVAPTEPRFNIFRGVQIPQAKKSVYVNAKANLNITAIAGHELYHTMERTRPELHSWFRKQAAEYFKNFPDYKEKLNALLQPGEQEYGDDSAASELIADFTGDALSDKDFLQKLSKNDPNKFVGLLRAVIKFLSRAVIKLTNLGSSKYISDVEALRDKLAIVLDAYANGTSIEDAIQKPSHQTNKITFSRNGNNDGHSSTEISEKKLGLEPESDSDAFIRKIQNDQVRWLRQIDAIKERGGVITDQNNVYQAMERMSARAMARTEDFYEKKVTPVLKEMRESGVKLDEVGNYLYAIHAKERNAYIKEINPAFAKSGYRDVGGSGMSDAEADRVIISVESDSRVSEIKKYASIFKNWSEHNLDNLVEGGLLDPDQASAMRQRFPNYVPLKGFESKEDEGEILFHGASFSNPKKLFNNALGRRTKADNPASYIIHSVAEGFLAKEKAHVGGYLERLIKANPDESLWTVDKPAKKQILGKDSAGNPAVIEIDRGYDPDKEVRFIRNGKPVRIQLKDPLLARAYNNRGHNEIDLVTKSASTINSFLREMWTQKNPVFPIVNMIRDVPSGMLYATGEGGFNLAGKLLINLPGAWLTMWKKAKGQPVKNNEWAKWLTEYRAAGGGIGFRMVGDIESTMDKIKRIQRRVERGTFQKALAAGHLSDTAKIFASSVIELIEHLNQAFENMTRLAIYRAARESELSISEASRMAKNATVNFNRKGESTSQINSWWLFANAAIQDVAKNKRSVADAPHRKKVQAVLAGFATLGFALAALNDDDDELEEENRNVNALRFKMGDATVNIPLSYGLIGFMHYFGRSALKVLKGEDVSVQSLRLAGALFNNLLPINPLINPDRPDIQNFVVGVTPTPLQFPIQVALNRNSFGSDMRPDYNDNPDAYKSFRGTRQSIYSEITEWLNESTGGDKRRPGAIDVSPETLKAFIHFSLGGTGKFVADSASTTADLVDGGKVKSNKVPVLNRFVSETDVTTYRARFYRQANEAKENLSLANKYRKDGNMDQFRGYAKWILTGRTANQLWKQMNDLRDQELMAKDSLKGETLDARLEQLEEQQIALSNRFHKMYEQTAKPAKHILN